MYLENKKIKISKEESLVVEMVGQKETMLKSLGVPESRHITTNELADKAFPYFILYTMMFHKIERILERNTNKIRNND